MRATSAASALICRMRDEDEARAADLGLSVFGNAGAGASDDGEATAGEPERPEDREDEDDSPSGDPSG